MRVLWRAVVVGAVECISRADEELSGVLVSISGVEVRQIVVGGGSEGSMGDKIGIAVVCFWIFSDQESGEWSVGVEMVDFGVDPRDRAGFLS